MKKELRIVLPDIRSVHNIGSIFRSADGAGVSAIYLTGYSPTPLDRFNKKRKDMAKVALGAEDSVKWEYYAQIEDVITLLHKEGFTVVGVEQAEGSVPYTKFNFPQKTALVFGNEVEGISKEVLSLMDGVVEIPLSGKKESLNVSVTAGVMLFAVRDF
ncbi:MAG: TrmH family RNA methyltransferase [Candidatus Paceibacterota bacterium]